MRKYLNLSFLFAVLALVSGVFYREFTKYNGFEGRTPLGFTHVHLFVLGAMFLLLVGLLNDKWNLSQYRSFQWFERLYYIGLPFMVIMFYVRGIFVVLGTDLSRGASAAISGIAGLSHMMVGGAIIALYLALRKANPKISE